MSLFRDVKSLVTYSCRSYSTLKQIFKEPLRPEVAAAQLRERLQRREEHFTDSVRRTVFDNPKSPYLTLLRRAGCSYDDFRALVRAEGIEGCLRKVKEEGVYITIEEFKGKTAARRGNDTFRFTDSDFDNPLLRSGYATQSGGSRSSGSRMTVPVEYVKLNNVYGVVAAAAYGSLGKPVILYLPILPAGEGLFFNLRFAAMGNPPVKWFSQIDEQHIKPPVINKLKTQLAIWMSRFYGLTMPGPEFIDMRNTEAIARWMHLNRGSHGGFTIVTYASSALRLALEARKAGLSLGDTTFWLMGEPLTEKIAKEISATGCTAYSLYGCNELMQIGQGCANPSCADDMHFCMDKLAVIQDERLAGLSGEKVNSYYFTTLLDSSPKVFLNTETGDFGGIETRDCGCLFGELGFTTHLHSVRSFEKLTAEGATFLGSDLIDIIQQVLPANFGGSANDYQFVEETSSEGLKKMVLLVNPSLGPIDENKIEKSLFEALTENSARHVFGRAYWEQAETLRIRRALPVPTARGKIHPLHVPTGPRRDGRG